MSIEDKVKLANTLHITSKNLNIINTQIRMIDYNNLEVSINMLAIVNNI